MNTEKNKVKTRNASEEHGTLEVRLNGVDIENGGGKGVEEAMMMVRVGNIWIKN